jgi:predicted nuclease with TOPRIM domain
MEDRVDRRPGVVAAPPLEERLRRRLSALESEFEDGRRVLAELEAKQTSLRETLLRLSGAISVLREELGAAGGEPSDDRRPDGQ